MVSTTLRIFLALQLVTFFGAHVNALPITSKPIEGTAEQMAWKAWIMLPPEQKNLEKSRKVTPKSIFTLPNRSCPPGHQLSQSNCIPIVNINEKELLTQQILGFIVDEANGNNSFDYDYDDIGTEIADFIYEQAEKLSGGGAGGADQSNRDQFQYDQLPSQDQPLKFNIFQQKFPTDYETESMPSDEPQEQQLNKSQNATEIIQKNSTTIPLANTVNVLSTKELNATLSNSTTNSSTMDLQTDSSNISVSFAIKNSSDDDGDGGSGGVNIGTPQPSPSAEFSVSDIDAIILPAVPTHNANLEHPTNKQNVQRVSLFKDDSSVQLVTSTLLAERDVVDQQQKKQPDLSQLLKADGLLPLPNIIASKADQPGSSAVRDRATTARTRTSSIYIDNDVSTLSTVITNVVDDTTTPLSGNIIDNSAAIEGEVTTFPTHFDGFYENNEKVAAISEVMTTKHDRYNVKKGEHPRSVKTKNETSELTAAQEEKFTTTTEPDVTTTNFQLDDTTVDELHDAPTIALKELLELAQHPSAQRQENLGIVVKKSKVEPVEIPPIVYTEPETTPSEMTASTRSAPISTAETTATPTPTATSPKTLMLTDDGEVSPSSPSSFVLKTTTPSSAAKNDRFGNQQLDIGTKAYFNLPVDDDDGDDDDDYDGERQRNASSNDERHVDSNFRNTKTAKPTTTATPTSEIDIKQELRMINELVKGNNNNANNKRKEQSKLGIIKTERSNTTESRLTTATGVQKSTKINSDKNVESITKDTPSKQQEDESTITSTVKTISTPMTTTTMVATDTTATMWTKIVPLFNFSTSTIATASTRKTTTPSQSTENMPSETSSTIAAATSPSPSKSVSNDAINARINRSDRNSKIFRINTLVTPSFSDSDRNSNSNRNSKTNNNHADKHISSTTTSPTTTTENTESADNSSAAKSSSINSSNENNPFWWLPIGWRLDRPSEVSSEPSLLQRLWTAFPESAGTTRLRN